MEGARLHKRSAEEGKASGSRAVGQPLRSGGVRPPHAQSVARDEVVSAVTGANTDPENHASPLARGATEKLSTGFTQEDLLVWVRPGRSMRQRSGWR